MKRILKILLVCLIVFTSRVFAIEPTEEFYINDYANILSEETEEYIQTNSVSLANATTAQIVVVTVPSLNGVSLEEYSTNLFRQFGIGDKEKNNGLLILRIIILMKEYLMVIKLYLKKWLMNIIMMQVMLIRFQLKMKRMMHFLTL